MNSRTRKAYVAGRFYPESGTELINLIEEIRRKEKPDFKFDSRGKNIIGGILPHAGHMYSGYQTVHFFEALSRCEQNFETFVLLHPIHRGGSKEYASDANDYWETPLGKLELDEEFIEYSEIPRSEEIHKWEHSAEVILPFLQAYGFKEQKILPVGISWQHPESAKKIAHQIHKTQKELNRNICILASSDFSHFVDPEDGRKQDQKAIDEIVKLNPEVLYNTIRDNNISICGYGPIMTLMYYSLFSDEEIKTEILARGHSGEVSPGDSVVDYISMIFYS